MITVRDVSNALAKICSPKGFVRRGNALFRIQGDGILQVIKPEKVQYYSEFDIYIGLFSMYGNLSPEWFTSSGCIPRYTVANFIGQRSTVYLENIGNRSYRRIIAMEQQLETFESVVLPFLDGILTQEQLAEGICELDRKKYDTVLWVDALKLEPFLYCENYNLACKVVNAKQYQYEKAMQSNYERLGEDKFLKMMEERKEFDEKYIFGPLRVASSRDPEIIKAYLRDNYEENCGYARFILKSTQKKK